MHVIHTILNTVFRKNLSSSTKSEVDLKKGSEVQNPQPTSTAGKLQTASGGVRNYVDCFLR